MKRIVKRSLLIVTLSAVSTVAFAGRDGAQVMLQEAANKKVAAERRLASSHSDEKHVATTIINGARVVTLPQPNSPQAPASTKMSASQ